MIASRREKINCINNLQAAGFVVEAAPLVLWQGGIELTAHRKSDNAGFLLSIYDIRLVAQYGPDVLWPQQPGSQGLNRRYIDAAIAAEVQAVAGAPEGMRNDTLMRATYNLATLIPKITEEEVRYEMRLAASICGLPDKEAASVIERMIARGKDSPREGR